MAMVWRCSCGQRAALYRVFRWTRSGYRSYMKADPEHDLCFRCYRGMIARIAPKAHKFRDRTYTPV